MLRHLALLALPFVCFILMSCASKDSKNGGSDGYTRSELFGKSADVAVNNYLRKFHFAYKAADGEIYLGSPQYKHVISDMSYANTDDPVADGDRVRVWKKGDRFLLLRADPNIGVDQQWRVLREWCQANLVQESQRVDVTEEENPDFD